MTTLDRTAIKAAHDAALPVIERNAAPFHVIDVAVTAYLDALSSLPEQAVTEEITAYELQVLIGTSISGCNMSPDRVFDLKAAWSRLYKLGLIDRTDGIASPTKLGEARIRAARRPSGDGIRAGRAEVGTIRVCPERDARCPHGIDCPYSIDRYRCDMEASPRALNGGKNG